MARSLVVNIVGDATSLERELKKSSRAVDTFQKRATRSTAKTQRSFAGMGKGLAGLGVGAGVGFGATAAIKSSIVAASDLEQQIGKTSVVFGDSAEDVEAWSKTLADSFGLSQRAALTTASDFGALFKPIGLTGDAAADQSKKLTELGADLASFYNTDVQQALDAVRSGLVGEAEPLRKYGVLLSETRVQQQAMADTGKRNATSLTVQEKALARVKIILEDSKVAQGDFNRTQDTAANQAKILKANYEDLSAELGTGLIPALAEAAHGFNELLDAREKVKGSRFGFLVSPLTAQLKSFKNTTEDLLTQLGLVEKKVREVFPPAGVLGPASAPVVPPAGARGPVFPKERPDKAARARLRRAAAAFRAERRERRDRIRQAAEAARQAIQDRAEFNVEKTGATKTLKDDLAALRHYNALLTRRIKGGHGTLELEREQFRVQMQIADVLKQQADLAKKTKKRVGVDVTRFQKTARGQFVLAGAAGGPRGIHIANMTIHGVQNVAQLENELARRSKQRARQRRAR